MNKCIPALLSIVLSLMLPVAWPGPVDVNAAADGSADKIISTTAWTRRVISEKELEKLCLKDAEISPSVGLRLLARLNARDFDYIAQDIRDGKPIKVPNDFHAFKNWTPLQHYLPEVADLPKFILIVKDIPFVGWYENGKLVGDSYACVGKIEGMTREGLFSVKEKDISHVSRSYPNAWGVPAPMPWALRVYDTVWIHAGDIIGGYCSHGCINLPIFPAMKLFDWAKPGTPVLIVKSLDTVPSILVQNRSNCSLHASVCNPQIAAGS